MRLSLYDAVPGYSADYTLTMHLNRNYARYDSLGNKEFTIATNCGHQVSVRENTDNGNKESQDE